MDGNGIATRDRRSNNRRETILDCAARCFCENGYAATSMRDIAAAAGMLAGSLYYHFPSKTALLLAVHAEGVRRIGNAVDAAIEAAPSDRPWDRLEAGMSAHLECLLDTADYAQVVIQDLPTDEIPIRENIISLRNTYEERFRSLIDALPIASDRKPWLRLMLMGAMNWTRVWYRDDGAPPARIAREFIGLVRAAAPERRTAHVEC